MKIQDIIEAATKDTKEERRKCPKCGKEGRVNKEGEIVAYGCFYCSPVRLPKRRR